MKPERLHGGKQVSHVSELRHWELVLGTITTDLGASKPLLWADVQVRKGDSNSHAPFALLQRGAKD